MTTRLAKCGDGERMQAAQAEMKARLFDGEHRFDVGSSR